MKRQAGMSLAELIVWAFLASIVLSVSALFLRQVLRLTSAGITRTQLYETALVATNQLTNDLQDANASGVANYPSTDDDVLAVLSIHPQNDATNAHQPLFEPRLIMWSWNPQARALTRLEALPPVVTLEALQPFRPDAVTARTLAVSNQVRRRLLGPGATAFSLTNLDPLVPPDRLGGAMVLKLKLEDENKQNSYTVERTLRLRSSL